MSTSFCNFTNCGLGFRLGVIKIGMSLRLLLFISILKFSCFWFTLYNKISDFNDKDTLIVLEIGIPSEEATLPDHEKEDEVDTHPVFVEDALAHDQADEVAVELESVDGVELSVTITDHTADVDVIIDHSDDGLNVPLTPVLHATREVTLSETTIEFEEIAQQPTLDTSMRDGKNP